MALDLNIVRLLERLVGALEKIATEGIHLHHHDVEEEHDYKVHHFLPPGSNNPTGGTKQ